MFVMFDSPGSKHEVQHSLSADRLRAEADESLGRRQAAECHGHKRGQRNSDKTPIMAPVPRETGEGSPHALPPRVSSTPITPETAPPKVRGPIGHTVHDAAPAPRSPPGRCPPGVERVQRLGRRGLARRGRRGLRPLQPDDVAGHFKRVTGVDLERNRGLRGYEELSSPRCLERVLPPA